MDKGDVYSSRYLDICQTVSISTRSETHEILATVCTVQAPGPQVINIGVCRSDGYQEGYSLGSARMLRYDPVGQGEHQRLAEHVADSRPVYIIWPSHPDRRSEGVKMKLVAGAGLLRPGRGCWLHD